MRTLLIAVVSLVCLSFAATLSAAPVNDFFVNSAHLEGTDITYVGDLTGATFEVNEPNPGGTNTIWVSWAMPFTGRARFRGTYVSWYQPVAIYCGPTLDLLQPVRTVPMYNGRFDFLAIEGRVYHFQIAGSANDCALSLKLNSWGQATNDNFIDAVQLKGEYPVTDPGYFSILGATAEPGEPQHSGPLPFKSLWWHWQAPVHGTMHFECDRSLVTNVVLAAYSGTSIGALTLINKGTNEVRFDATGGETYWIAAAMSDNAVGDVLIEGQYGVRSSASRPVPGNLLLEPSWEGTALEPEYWGTSGAIGGAVNELSGADGTTWPTLNGNAQVWQDIPTVPGQNHSIRFAIRADGSYVGGGSGDGRVRVLWEGQEIGIGVLPESEIGFWHWLELTAVANYPTSRVTFVNLGRNIELDAFSVVSLTAPPEIITQPVSSSVFNGGTAVFTVTASGSSPLKYCWYFNGSPLTVLTDPVLLLESVTTNHAGTYQVVVTNVFGAVTSAPVTLSVEAPNRPVILWQPYGDTVPAGGCHNFSVVAAGTSPLTYQWLKNNVAITGATNRNLVFNPVNGTNAGIYTVRVQNNAGTVWSLGANLVVSDALPGGGTINFANRFVPATNLNAPVFDIDCVTKLNGSGYLAQLYGGPSLELLRPVGQPSPFLSGFDAGYFSPQIVTLPNVAPGSNAVLQVRAWDESKGITYEEARGLGGKFGKSQLLTATAGGGAMLPADVAGLQSFCLQAGLPQFTVGQISFVSRQPGGVVVWSHRGEPGFRYLIEKSVHGFEWRPYLVITNVQSTTTFTDSANSESSTVFYRSRVLD